MLKSKCKAYNWFQQATPFLEVQNFILSCIFRVSFIFRVEGNLLEVTYFNFLLMK